MEQFSSNCDIYICQVSADGGCNEISTLERKLLDVMNGICDLLGSVCVDEWLSVPSSVASDIQRLLLQRFLVALVAAHGNCVVDRTCQNAGFVVVVLADIGHRLA